MVLAGRKLKLRELSDTLKRSKGSVFTILHENLSMRKLKWVLRLLKVDQKQQRIDDSERRLEMFRHNKKDFFIRYVTMDEKWIYYYIPESNRQSAEWTANVGNCPKRPKTQMSPGKVLASVFWDAHGILFIDYLEKERTIYSEYYMMLLVRLKEGISKKWPQMKKKKVLTLEGDYIDEWSRLLPKSCFFSHPTNLLSIQRSRKRLFSTKRFSNSLKMCFVLCLWCLYTCSKCSPERSVSFLKRVKNYFGSTMTEDQLNVLVLLSIEAELFLSFDYQDVINDCAFENAGRKVLIN